MKRAGLHAVTAKQLADIIRGKIQASYFYNLCIDRTNNVAKFNLIVEVPQATNSSATRLLVAIEYNLDHRVLRLITLY